jgi:hypothetical protein
MNTHKGYEIDRGTCAAISFAAARLAGNSEESMETSSSHWLPLTEYALRSGMSISTLRRKIKSNTIDFKMEEGRYLIRSDDLSEAAPVMGFASSDSAPRIPNERASLSAPALPQPSPASVTAPAAAAPSPTELAQLREEFRRMQEDNLLRWKALEARVAGLVRKVEFFTEQMAETKMLVKIFEEKLDHRA